MPPTLYQLKADSNQKNARGFSLKDYKGKSKGFKYDWIFSLASVNTAALFYLPT